MDHAGGPDHDLTVPNARFHSPDTYVLPPEASRARTAMWNSEQPLPAPPRPATP